MKPARLLVLLALTLTMTRPAAAAEPVQPGDFIDSFCTLAFVYDAPDGSVFFASAAHCFARAGQVVHLAELTPDQNAAPTERLGVVRLLGDKDRIATDVALIEVDPALRARVAPEVRGHPTIPSGIAAEAAPGDLLQLSGWGMGFNTTEDTRQQRQGALLSSTPGYWVGATPIQGGDSGGPVAHAATGAAYGLVKGYGCRTEGDDGEVCGTSGPTVAGVDALAASGGLRLRMRRAGEPAPLPAATDPAPAPGAPPSSGPGTSPATPGCRTPLGVVLQRADLRRRRLALAGALTGDACAAAGARVHVALSLRSGRRCRHLAGRRLTRAGTCRPRWVEVPVDGGAWQLKRRLRLPAGRYTVRARVTGASGRSTAASRSLRLR